MESDILWNEYYNTQRDGYGMYRSLWMTLCANISQCGKPVVLCGCTTPDQFESRPERAAKVKMTVKIRWVYYLWGDYDYIIPADVRSTPLRKDNK